MHVPDGFINASVSAATGVVSFGTLWAYIRSASSLIADKFIWTNLKNLKIPTLIIRAQLSNAFLESAANKVNKENKKIKIITMDKVTHLFPLEEPFKTSEIINDFLEN